MVDHDPTSIRFVSLGMVILDELHLPGREPRENVLGGSCSYSTVGACLAVEGATEQIGCLVLAGNDFPIEADNQISSWESSLILQKRADRESMRGKLQYHHHDFAHKTFGYMTPALQPSPKDLPLEFLSSTSFHFLASPDQAVQQRHELLRLREEHGITSQPLLIWEPLPLHCKPNSLAAHVEASKLFDVFSPNHLELDALCGRLQSQGDYASSEFGREHIQSCTAAFMADHSASPRSEQLCIVRADEYGALVASRSETATGAAQIDMTWVDAFYSTDEKDKIVDATGAGNAFLGALAIELQQNSGDAVEAAVKASVASSFVVDQIGLPVVSTEGGSDLRLWNGVSVASRMEEYEQKARPTRHPSMRDASDDRGSALSCSD